MNSQEIRKWLDRYGEKNYKLLSSGYGCLYTEDATNIALCVRERAVRYANDKDILFNEDHFTNVASFLKQCIEDVTQNHLNCEHLCLYGENKGKMIPNSITHTILFNARATGGFGVWIVRETSPKLEEILNNPSKENLYAMTMLCS